MVGKRKIRGYSVGEKNERERRRKEKETKVGECPVPANFLFIYTMNDVWSPSVNTQIQKLGHTETRQIFLQIWETPQV